MCFDRIIILLSPAYVLLENLPTFIKIGISDISIFNQVLSPPSSLLGHGATLLATQGVREKLMAAAPEQWLVQMQLHSDWSVAPGRGGARSGSGLSAQGSRPRLACVTLAKRQLSQSLPELGALFLLSAM